MSALDIINNFNTTGNNKRTEVAPQSDALKTIQGDLGGRIKLLDDLPDNGRIYLEPDNSFSFTSKGFSTSEQEKITPILEQAFGHADPHILKAKYNENATYSAQTTPMEGVETDLGKQDLSKFTKEMLSKYPETALAGQQLFEGGLFAGTSFDAVFDEMNQLVQNDPGFKRRYNMLKEAYLGEYPERAIPLQMIGALMSVVIGGRFLQGFGGIKKVKEYITKFKKAFDKQPPLGKRTAQVGGATGLAWLEGLISGYNEGEEGDENLVAGIQRANTNAMFTLPIAMAFPSLKNIFSAGKSEAQKISTIAEDMGVSIEAATKIKEAFDNGMTLQDMLINAHKVGDERMITDVSQAMRELLDESMNSGVSPTALETGTKNLSERQKRLYKDQKEQFNKLFGYNPAYKSDIFNEVTGIYDEQIKNAYKTANKRVINYETVQGERLIEKLQLMDSDVLNKAFAEGNRLARADGLILPPIKATFNKQTGRNEIFGEPTMPQLDYLYKGLGQVIKQSENAKGVPTDIAGIKFQQGLKDAIIGVNSDYGKALSLFAGTERLNKAISYGQKFFDPKVGVDTVKQFMKVASETEKEAYKRSVRGKLDEILSEAKSLLGKKGDFNESDLTAVEELKKAMFTLSSRKSQSKMMYLLGAKDYAKLQKNIVKNIQSYQSILTAAKNSATAGRQQGVKRTTDLVKGGPIKTLFADGDVKGAVTKIKNKLMGNPDDYLDSRLDEVYGEIAGILTTKQGKDVDLALSYIDEVLNGSGKLSEPKANFVTKILRESFRSPINEAFFGIQGANTLNNLGNVSP